jgi:hypothetical protein
VKVQSPLLGYNNNVRHKGRVFHIQTEDSGVKHPHIITHLFADGGRILKSTKTSYADQLGVPGLEELVRSMMKEQHKAMFIALRDGQFDHLLEPGAEPRPSEPRPQPRAAEAKAVSPEPSGAPASQSSSEAPSSTAPTRASSRPAPRGSSPPAARAASPPSPPAPSAPAPPGASARPSEEAQRPSRAPPPPSIPLGESRGAAGKSVLPPRVVVRQSNPPPRPGSRPPPPVMARGSAPRVHAPSAPTEPAFPAPALPDLELDALERAAVATEQSFFTPMRDLPPPPAAVLGQRPTPSLRNMTPTSTPAAAPGPVGGRYAVTRPASIFATTKPTEGASIFGEDLISEKSLDEVILSYLADDLETGDKR